MNVWYIYNFYFKDFYLMIVVKLNIIYFFNKVGFLLYIEKLIVKLSY